MKEIILLVGLLLAGAMGRKYLTGNQEHPHDHPKMAHKHGESMLSFDYFACHSGIGYWNAGWKMILAVFLLVVCLCVPSWQICMSVILISTYVTVVLGYVHWHEYRKIMMIPVTFLFLGSVPVLFEISRTAFGTMGFHCGWFYIGVTRESARKVVHLWLKAGGAVNAMFMLSLTTPLHEMFTVLKKMKVPGILIELMNLMYRYIFVLLDTHSRMKNAAKSRLGYCGYKTSLYSFGQIGGNLFLISLKKASAYYDAMESRCYDGELEFLQEEKPMTKEQAAAGVFITVYLVVIYLVTR